MDEIYLIEKLKLKDERAFREFIDLNKTKVLNICFGFVHNKQDAEDIAQEVFIEVFLSVKNFRSDSTISTWLYRITVNKSLDFIKKSNRKKRAGKILSIFGLSHQEKEYLKHNSNPLAILENNENFELLIKAIDKLPENQKAAITLNKFENLSYKEISDILKTTTSAVDSLIQRAKNNLKKILVLEGF